VSIFGVSWKRGQQTLLAVLGVASVSLVFAGVSWGAPAKAVTAATAVTASTATYYNPATDPYSMYNLASQMGAPAWWNAGYTGQGVDVALIDTGVAPVKGLNGSGKVFYGPDLSLESQNPKFRNIDTNGHGTFMAGLIAGNDNTSYSSPWAYRGIAPGARIVSLKVGDADGGTDVTQVIAAIDWVVQHAQDPGFNIRVINLSYGTLSTDAYTSDPLAYAAEQAWKHGIVVVAAAGNTGGNSGNGTGLTDPAYDPYILGVGAYNTMGTNNLSDDVVAPFSARSNGCSGCKDPDLVAPGTHMQGLRVPGSYIDQTHPEGVISDRYFRGSGTSEAAAITSGVVALLLDKYPDLTPDQVKGMLTDSAQMIPGFSADFQGAGAINLSALASEQDPNNGSWLQASQYAQNFPSSNGTGSVEASRGGDHLTQNGVMLTGNQDIFGNPFNSRSMAQAEANASSWSGGWWNGSLWTGNSWSGSSWSSAVWTGSSWSGSSWSGSSWSGNSWSGSSWSGSSWSGSSWSGNSWSGDDWAGVGWS
jgi:serine protease AprX